jgi:lactate dehydrogenase-like 2-hydroxyacid dehydrogenase
MNDLTWAIAIGGLVIVGTIGRAVARLIRAYATRIETVQPRGQEQLSGPELEEVHRRLAELEERLDFTERLLANQRDAKQLPESR